MNVSTRHAAHSKFSRLRTLPQLAISIAVAACAAPGEPPRIAPGPFAGAAAPDAGAEVIPVLTVCAADNPFCAAPPLVTPTATGVPAAPTNTNCGTLPIDVRPAGVNIMLAIDGAAAMKPHWADIGKAVRSLRQANPTASFGVHLFWGDPVDLFTQTNGNTTNNGCSKVNNKFLELGNHTTEQLIAAYGDAPLGGMITDVYQVSPVIEPLSYYLANASTLADPKRTNYLLVFTGGNDNCFGSAFSGTDAQAVAYQKLASELGKLNIRTIPIGVDPPSTTDPAASPAGGLVGTSTMTGGFLGIGATTMLPTTNYSALGTLLKYGGSGLTEVPRIDTPAKLAELVSQVGSTVNNCRFEIPAALDSSMSVNPFELSFSINGRDVPRDRHQVNGWDFVNASTNQVEFFGQGCQALQSGQTVAANKSCAQDICGTAAVSVQTKPRTVLFLLDSSLSRTECTDGSTDCISLPGSTPDRPFSYWEVVENAVSVAVAAPINDDVAFGMQFFPSKNAETLSCDVLAQPEIPPAPGMQIKVMQAMLEKFPLGLSPVVAALESVAAAPGKLADPGVVGSVVLLSDGGDNCTGDRQTQMVARLSAAAKKLATAGVKTYAIRYGSAGSETPDQAEQLTAIVNNAGTALAGAKVPYIDAKTPDELSMALAGLSDRLATCSFPLDGIKPDVDKSRTNLFLNGEQIGFDAKGTKQDGWNWVNPERTIVELYGNACTAFKTNRRTRVAVEFGCEQVEVKGPD